MKPAEILDSVPDPPRYWTDEQSGVLRPAVLTYLAGRQMTNKQLGAMKAYLRQWAFSSAWNLNPNATNEDKEQLARVRAKIDAIHTPQHLRQAIQSLEDLGMDPL